MSEIRKIEVLEKENRLLAFRRRIYKNPKQQKEDTFFRNICIFRTGN